MRIEKFDFVHDTQKIYRKLLDSMSKPGKINNISNEIKDIEIYSSLSKDLMGIIYTLLNLESKFYIEDKEESKFIKLHTLAKEKNIENAEFIIFDIEKENKNNLIEIVEKCEVGTLEDPNLGSTLILKVKKIQESGDLILRGPGIKNSNEFSIDGLDEVFFKKREAINKEFPMGIDIILIDQDANIACLPRTTSIEVGL